MKSADELFKDKDKLFEYVFLINKYKYVIAIS